MTAVVCPQKDERFVALADTLDLCAGMWEEKEIKQTYCEGCSFKSKCDAWWSKVSQQGSQARINSEQSSRWLLQFQKMKSAGMEIGGNG